MCFNGPTKGGIPAIPLLDDFAIIFNDYIIYRKYGPNNDGPKKTLC